MSMKKSLSSSKPKLETEPMPETDFRGSVRGKHYKKYRASVVTVSIDGGVPKRVTKTADRASRQNVTKP